MGRSGNYSRQGISEVRDGLNIFPQFLPALFSSDQINDINQYGKLHISQIVSLLYCNCKYLQSLEERITALLITTDHHLGSGNMFGLKPWLKRNQDNTSSSFLFTYAFGP